MKKPPNQERDKRIGATERPIGPQTWASKGQYLKGIEARRMMERIWYFGNLEPTFKISVSLIFGACHKNGGSPFGFPLTLTKKGSGGSAFGFPLSLTKQGANKNTTTYQTKGHKTKIQNRATKKPPKQDHVPNKGPPTTPKRKRPHPLGRDLGRPANRRLASSAQRQEIPTLGAANRVFSFPPNWFGV